MNTTKTKKGLNFIYGTCWQIKLRCALFVPSTSSNCSLVFLSYTQQTSSSQFFPMISTAYPKTCAPALRSNPSLKRNKSLSCIVVSLLFSWVLLGLIRRLKVTFKVLKTVKISHRFESENVSLRTKKIFRGFLIIQLGSWSQNLHLQMNRHP